MYYGLKASSRSRTDFSSLIRIVVRFGYWSCGVLCAVTRAGYWGICSVSNVGQRNDREEVTYESETVQYGFDYSSSKWGAAQLAHVLRYWYITCYWRVVVDDHVYYIGAQLEPLDVNWKVWYTHSSAFSTLFSIASAALPNVAFHTWVWMNMSAGKNRISRFGFFEDDSFLHVMSSRARVPTR